MKVEAMETVSKVCITLGLLSIILQVGVTKLFAIWLLE